MDNELSKMIKETEKISSALVEMLDADEELTKDFIIDQARELLIMFNSDDTVFYEGLHDEDINVRNETRNEKRRLEKFIKKYS